MPADVAERSTAAAPAATPARDVGRRAFALYRLAVRAQARAELERRATGDYRQDRVALWQLLVAAGDVTRQALP